MKAQVKKGLPPCQGRTIRFRHVQAGLAKLKEVPVVLNMISDLEMTPVETTQKPLPRFGMGACLPVSRTAASPASQGAIAYRRPSDAWAAPATGMGQRFALTVSGQAVGSAASDQQSAYNKTLTIAEGAGDLGPHPAREPV
jgi:hypothetical protein